MRRKPIKIPTPRTPRKNRYISRKRGHSAWTLKAAVDEHLQFPKPSLIFHRYYPTKTMVVPPVLVPLYWFDRYMVTRKQILPIGDDVFVCDGRRFKAIAQDRKTVGRFMYDRWLVYEEAAVGKDNSL